MNQINYQKELDKLIEKLKKEGRVPTLLLHVCCAPCSSYCLEYLSKYFKITVYFYNPNISEAAEYEKRRLELIRLIETMPFENPVSYMISDYEPKEFYEAVPDRAHDHEGGESCFKCYELRLAAAAKKALAGGFDYFTTSLSISPLKNAPKLNEIGTRLAAEMSDNYESAMPEMNVMSEIPTKNMSKGGGKIAEKMSKSSSGVRYLFSDFKKKNGYKRSIELSREYDLYRQDFCGCIFSKNEREKERITLQS